VERLDDGTVRLTVDGPEGWHLQVERTEDFGQWTLVTNVVNTAGTVTLEDGGARGEAQRYYRVLFSEP